MTKELKNGIIPRGNFIEISPAEIWSDGSKFWYQKGKLHKENGPACEYASGGKQWYQNGLQHREDGPAQEWSDGRRYWFINGKRIT